DPADGVVPAIVPVDVGFTADHCPDAVGRAEGLARLAVGYECDQEGPSQAAAHTHLPLAGEVVPPGSGDAAGGRLEVNPSNVRQPETLLVSVFEDDGDRILIALRRGPGCDRGSTKHEHPQNAGAFSQIAHHSTPPLTRDRKTGLPIPIRIYSAPGSRRSAISRQLRPGAPRGRQEWRESRRGRGRGFRGRR